MVKKEFLKMNKYIQPPYGHLKDYTDNSVDCVGGEVQNNENMFISIVLTTMGEWNRIDIDCNNGTVKISRTGRILEECNRQLTNIAVKDFANRLLKITSSWVADMNNPYLCDGLKYYVDIKTNDKVTKYRGQMPNNTPENYIEFRKLLAEYKMW